MEQQQQDPFLFILLGFDTLYSINLNHLHLLKEEEADLEIMFSHRTHNKQKQPGFGNPYPIGMGLFVHDSKLHYFGGENIHVDDSFQNISFETGKPPRKYLSYITLAFLDSKNWENRINNKVFSFTPIFKSDEALSLVEDNTGCNFPSPSSYKMRPIVFTISDKVYALSTIPLIDASIKEEQDVFEVFEPCKRQWTKLPNPPCRLNNLVQGSLPTGLPLFNCVIKNQLLLQTRAGEYIFDVNHRKWFGIPYEAHNIVLASLEYKDKLLLFYERGNLVAYDLKSYEEYKGGLFWSSLEAVEEKNIFRVTDIPYKGCIWTASLSTVDDNSICLVFSCSTLLYVCHLEFIKHPCECEVRLKAYKKIYLPRVMRADPYTLSSFILKGDIGKSYQDSTTGGKGDVGKCNQDSTTGGKGDVGKCNQDSTTGGKGDVGKCNQDSTTGGKGDVGKCNQDSTTGDGEWKQVKRNKSRLRRGRRGIGEELGKLAF